ncbi:MAG: excisionase family DNA-binding protein [Nocardioidaceae bacterium]
MERLGYSIEEAAEQLGFGRSTMCELLASGEIESVKVGRRRIVPRDALVAYLDRLRSQQRPAEAERRAG